jgi:PAS domain S-box-containing protein
MIGTEVEFDRRSELERELGWFASGLAIVSTLPAPDSPGADDRIASIVATGLLSLPMEAVGEGIERALAVIGLRRAADRAFYYRIDAAAQQLTLVHEWQAAGRREMKALPQFATLPMATLPPAFLERLRQGAVLSLPRARGFLAGPIDELVDGQDDLALLLVPACLGGALIGVAGLACGAARRDEIDVAMLQIVAQGIARLVERRRVESALRVGEARFRAICESSPQGIFLSDERGGCVYVNPAAQQILGLSSEEAQGQGWMAALHPEDRVGVTGRWSTGVKEGSGYEVPLHRLVHRDGEVRSVLVRAMPINGAGAGADGGNGFLGLLEDVTERLRADRERADLIARAQVAHDDAESARGEIAAILSRVSDAFVAFDAEARFTYANDRALALLGRTRESLIGRGIFTDFPTAAGGAFEEAYRRAVADQDATVVEQYFPLAARWFSARIYPSPTGVSVFFQDITDRRSREEQLTSDREYLRQEVHGEEPLYELVGRSPALQGVIDRVRVVAATDATVLIAGETGTGKELVARAIHDASARRERLLVKVNCAAISPSLVESELFGHEKGAFTGAFQRRKGRFELADGGTLFLDEVGELPVEIQAKLLRVLQERELERVGGSDTIRVDVRIIAATNRNLLDLVAKGRFREDLYYRLNVFPLTMPPLRQRAGDIPMLVQTFVRRFARKTGKAIDGVSAEALRRLCAYHWPGNVRELQNVLERAVILTRGAVIEWDALSDLAAAPPPPVASVAAMHVVGGGSVRDIERSYVETTLRETGWVIEGARGAARRLGLHPNTLRSRLKRWGLSRPPSRREPPTPAEPDRVAGS